MRPEQAVPQRDELPVVVVVEQVVVGVVRRAVDDGLQDLGEARLVVVDDESPDDQEREAERKEAAVEGEEVDEDVPGNALGEAIDRMQCVGGKWSCDLPRMVLLVEVLVEEAVVECAVEPVVDEVGKEKQANYFNQRVEGS